ncbi:hypothetical protein [Streptomyces griseoaurantiacus]|uniref:Uncharacterized protein n=1 Tax=Streptomyces griseoaurantiacus TaxID=68213 RepID=A0A7W2HWY7_9ACTN|nr:hypothetical protein [Streptomyces griseoaurantiacus]MBA5224648.1 hypothetical protein [Streptomyces griseoaurantiacus]
MPPLLNPLGFKCKNMAYWPVMDGLVLLAKYADVDSKTRFYDAGDVVPMDGVVLRDWREAVLDDKGKVQRIPHELCVPVALRGATRRREIYVEAGRRWCHPEDDLPGDFESARTVHYVAIRQPEDQIVSGLKQRMTDGPDRLSAALANGSAGRQAGRQGEGHRPQGRAVDHRAEAGAAGRALKDEVVRRWNVLDLLDVLKNADSLTGFTGEVASVAAYEHIDRAVLQRRLLLALGCPSAGAPALHDRRRTRPRFHCGRWSPGSPGCPYWSPGMPPGGGMSSYGLVPPGRNSLGTGSACAASG